MGYHQNAITGDELTAAIGNSEIGRQTLYIGTPDINASDNLLLNAGANAPGLGNNGPNVAPV